MRASVMDITTAQPGELINLGTYPHTDGGTDNTPIQWLVLDNSGGEILVLSRYILDCKRYHGELTATSWRDCDLRRWLNNTFVRATFTAAEQELIRTVRNTNPGENSPDTDDRVFLLDVATVTRLTHKLGKGFLRARGTAFAKVRKADGCHLYEMDKNVPSDYLHEDGKTYGCSWWWLRNQGRLKDQGPDPTRAVFIGTRASIRHYARVDQARDGVRPALMLVGGPP